MANKYVVYKFVDIRDESVAYVGSTNNIVKRRLEHLDKGGKYNPKTFSKIYHDNPQNFSLEICCSFAYIDSVELRKGERIYFDILSPKYNLRRPYVSYDEVKLKRKLRQNLKYQNDLAFREAVKLKNNLKYQNNKTDPIYREKEKLRVKLIQNSKYKNDPIYREKERLRARLNYQKQKLVK